MACRSCEQKLRSVGLTPTIQRMAILDVLQNTHSHPTADEVLCHVREQFPTISRATAYNTLEALTQAGVILRITMDLGAVRYDADTEPHAHFRCRQCGSVFDLPLEREIDLSACAQGYRIESVRVYAYGVCPRCKDGVTAPDNTDDPPCEPEAEEVSDA
jgi:Fur family transcriptional regulator, peroxide stress response regulator